jgi:hypothetical protein
MEGTPPPSPPPLEIKLLLLLLVAAAEAVAAAAEATAPIEDPLGRTTPKTLGATSSDSSFKWDIPPPLLDIEDAEEDDDGTVNGKNRRKNPSIGKSHCFGGVLFF